MGDFPWARVITILNAICSLLMIIYAIYSFIGIFQAGAGNYIIMEIGFGGYQMLAFNL